jgi:hypothetical protein
MNGRLEAAVMSRTGGTVVIVGIARYTWSTAIGDFGCTSGCRKPHPEMKAIKLNGGDSAI